MVKITERLSLIFCLFICVCCSQKISSQGTAKTESQKTNEPVHGSRIAWDYTTLRKVSSSETGARYNGYARVVQLQDKSLLSVYEASGTVVAVKSHDLGNSWSSPVVVAAKPEHYNNANPDLLELQDKSILVCYNPRPGKIDPSRKFEIRTKKSYDGGATWVEEKLLYQAGHEFENGCWEPAAIQLPNGEVQLFFANEGPYTFSEEQNISMLRSSDNGLTWTKKPENISFRAGSRDGMPSPLLLQNKKEIVVAIEDNGVEQFKPYVVRTTLSDNWKNTVTGNSSRRNYALAERVGDSIYAGAPYIRQLKNGETILSYQGTEGRKNHMNTSEMKVVIGNDQARNFSRKTSPFPIPENTSGLWNSLCVLEDNTVVALTTTRGFSKNGTTEVWMIKGRVVPEVAAQKQTITVDGAQSEAVWSEQFPVFVGHKSATQLTSQVVHDDKYLYVLNFVKDSSIVHSAQNPEEGDGVMVQLDPANKSYTRPDGEVYSFFLSVDGSLVMKRGQEGQWVKANDTEVNQVKAISKATDAGYVQEIAIPWTLLGGKPTNDARIGLNVQLTESTGQGRVKYRESISANHADKPYTWLTLRLK
ncbi:sugar-binding protein [Rufibacter roseus]|uniref:Sugar-binding protein n=1 Tax=Rufibacter roseus TaxID=1567108 RepID=A0ABW2DRX5_9BACT|nr:sugar-binding protein [Rufibacter roseus]